MEYLSKKEILDLDDNSFLLWCKRICKRNDLTLNMIPKLRESVKKNYNIEIIKKPEIDKLLNIKPNQHFIFQNFHIRFYEGHDKIMNSILSRAFDKQKDIGFLCNRKLDVGYLNDEIEVSDYLITISHIKSPKNIEEIDAFTLATINDDNPSIYISATCARTYSNLNPSFGLLIRYILINYVKSIGVKDVYNTPVKDIDLFNYYTNWGFRFGDKDCNEIDEMTNEHNYAIETNTLDEFYNKYYNFKSKKEETHRMKMCNVDTSPYLEKMCKFLENKLTKVWDHLKTINFSKSYFDMSMGKIDKDIKNFTKIDITSSILDEFQKHELFKRLLNNSFGESINVIPEPYKTKYNEYAAYLKENHRMMWIWGRSNPNPYVWDENIFPKKPKKMTKKSTKKSSTKKSSTNMGIFRGFQYNNNTCYMDSLFTTLFVNKKSVFYKNIINLTDADIDHEPYDNYKVVCSKNSKINTKESIREFTKNIRDQLKEDIKNLNEGHETVTCSLLRNKFKECLTDITGGYYSIVDLFTLIGDLFPKIKFEFKPYYSEVPLKTVYLPLSNYLGDEDIDFLPHYNNHLVFYNNGMIRGHDLSKDGVAGNFYIINPLDLVIDIKGVKFELTGVIVLQGVSQKKQEGGDRYVSYFKTASQWYYYNDVKDIDRIVKFNVEDNNFFMEKNENFPEMYFYTKI